MPGSPVLLWHCENACWMLLLLSAGLLTYLYACVNWKLYGDHFFFNFYAVPLSFTLYSFCPHPYVLCLMPRCFFLFFLLSSFPNELKKKHTLRKMWLSQLARSTPQIQFPSQFSCMTGQLHSWTYHRCSFLLKNCTRAKQLTILHKRLWGIKSPYF